MLLRHSNEQRHQGGQEGNLLSWKSREGCVSVSRRANGIKYFWFEIYWKFKPLFQKKLYQFYFPQKLLVAQKLRAAKWRHLFLPACGVKRSHFLIWQCSFKWHFQHHLEDREIQSGWQRQRRVWSNPSWQILIQEIRENGRPWA